MSFWCITGFPCQPLTAAQVSKDSEEVSPDSLRFWSALVGPAKKIRVEDVLAMLKAEPNMPGWRKFRLVLMVIVDGILICGMHHVKPSSWVVELLKDLNTFFAYPWGRLSFQRTFRMVIPGPYVGCCFEVKKNLMQASVTVHGFPVALQLFMCASVPKLLFALRANDFDATFLERRFRTYQH